MGNRIAKINTRIGGIGPEDRPFPDALLAALIAKI